MSTILAEGIEAHATYSKSLRAQSLPPFIISESNLGMGASLGNSSLWIHTKGTGAIERVFLNDVGQSLMGTVTIRYGARARPLSGIPDSGADQSKYLYSALFPEVGSRIFEIHPAYQRVRFQLASVLEIEETTFLPLGSGAPGREDSPHVYVMVTLRNRDAMRHHVRVVGAAMLRGGTPADVESQYDAKTHALVGFNSSQPNWVRIFGLSEQPSAYVSDFDLGAIYDNSHVGGLKNSVDAKGDLIARLQLDLTIDPGQERAFSFVIGLYAASVPQALQKFSLAESASTALQRSITHLEEVLCFGRVLTPDRVINHGALWSKVNMRRVMATYPTGCAFTNDPGKYANVVVRDCAWFIYGNDHFLPAFSRDILNNIGSRQYSNGKLPEYFDAVSGTVEDDGLNINDDTPLYILAVNHHFRASGDLDWLRSVYHTISAAARYIISQIDDRGLVFCTADDPRGDVWAIAGWRNIISGYSINGAVTELNAECVAALRAASHLADNLGGFETDKADFSSASARVQAAMDNHLINAANGLYYLNIDVEGNPHTDVTGDEIFPVMMRACNEETGFKIISRLNCPDFWTAAGLRTVSRYDPRFDPTAYSGLLGGVWPGLTWWYAFGAARYHPEMMVRALRSSFEHYGSAPRRNNTVPGQFSEWFDGESLENHGMRLSPWEPPRFLWAAVEGVCGLMLSPGPPKINPLIPAHWSWVGVRDLPYHGKHFTYFLVRERASQFRVYTTASVESDWDVMLYDRDVSDHVRAFSDAAIVIALARDDGMAILVGNSGEQTVQTPISIHEHAPPAAHLHVRTYDSERGDWEDGGIVTTADMRGASISIDAGGFRLIELSRA